LVKKSQENEIHAKRNDVDDAQENAPTKLLPLLTSSSISI